MRIVRGTEKKKERGAEGKRLNTYCKSWFHICHGQKKKKEKNSRDQNRSTLGSESQGGLRGTYTEYASYEAGLQ